MTDTAKELLELADRIAKAEAIEIVDADMIDRNFDPTERNFIASALRLSARQQASVEEVAEFLGHCDAMRIAGSANDDESELAHALLAKYDIFEKVEG